MLQIDDKFIWQSKRPQLWRMICDGLERIDFFVTVLQRPFLSKGMPWSQDIYPPPFRISRSPDRLSA
jgi:hypothetical protein